MKIEEQTLFEIKSLIASLPPEIEEAVNELAEHLRQNVRLVGAPIGPLAFALVRAEMQLNGMPK